MHTHCVIIVAFVHVGRAHFSFVRRLYVLSYLNCSLGDSLSKSGGHVLLALYGLFAKSKRGLAGSAALLIIVGSISYAHVCVTVCGIRQAELCIIVHRPRILNDDLSHRPTKWSSSGMLQIYNCLDTCDQSFKPPHVATYDSNYLNESFVSFFTSLHSQISPPTFCALCAQLQPESQAILCRLVQDGSRSKGCRWY